MKILFVTDCYPSLELPQYCVFLEQQAIALQKKGHTVEVFHFSKSQSDSENEIDRNGIKVYNCPCCYSDTLLDDLMPKCLPSEAEKEIDKILSNGYDAVSFHFGKMPLFITFSKLCKKHKVPFVCHFHGLNIWEGFYDPHPLLTKCSNMVKKHSYKKLSATVSVSDKVRSVFERKIKTVPSFIVYNGVNIDLFSFRENRTFFENNVVKILCVANLIPIKGQAYLIEAASKLAEMGVNVKLTFAGRGPDEEKLKQLASKSGVNADFTGYITYERIAELMQLNDLFIMPSFYEALGCVYLESMSAGMITVGVHTQGIDEIIENGKNGFLVEPQSVESIVNTVKQIVELPKEQLHEISRCGRATSEKLTWDESAASLESAYNKIICKKGR